MGTIMETPEELRLPERDIETNAALPENFDSRE